MWDLWRSEWHFGVYPPSTSVSSANSHPTNCSTFTNHPVIIALQGRGNEFILIAANVNNLECFQTSLRQILCSVPRTSAIAQNSFKNPEKNVWQFFSTDDLMFTMCEKRFPFSTLLSSGNNHKSDEAKVKKVRSMIQGRYAFSYLKLQYSKRRICRRFVVVKNQRVISPQLPSLAPHCINKPFQHLHVEYLINSGLFR
jgi:hypothetical protein